MENEVIANREALAAHINHLIQADFHRLVAWLYQLDISETKLKQTLEENTGKDAGGLIADLVLERQLQKMKTREQFKGRDDIPDEDRW